MATPIPDNDARFTADEVLAVTGARGALTGEVRGVSIDSRRVVEGNLFVALRGDVHDGHDHVAQAVERGAAAVLVERPVDVAAPALEVDDTRRALGALAAHHRARLSPDLIGVTGSVGKTTTKELLGAALRGIGRRPLVTEGNLNNRIGVPMTLFTLDPSHDAAVIEMGMSEPGEIADLARMASPRVGLVTAVAEVHTEGVGSLVGVAREKGALLEALGPDGVAVFNADDGVLAPHVEASAAGTKIGFGRAEHATLRLLEHTVTERGTLARYGYAGRQIEVELALLGAHAAFDAAGALAVVAALWPERIDDAARALAHVAPAPQRMAPRALGDLLVLDDTYNASPRSMRAAFETAAELARARGGGLVLVLGDMLELGAREQALHAEVGRAAVAVGAKALIACGERMSQAGRAALAASMTAGGARTKIVLLREAHAAAACVREVAASGDVVLVKGSRGMRMEQVIEALEASR